MGIFDANTNATSLGVCGNCHLVHNGQGLRMWSRDNITQKGDPSSLCLSCHKKGELADNKTIGKHSHPISVSIENAGIHVTKEGWVAEQGSNDNTAPPPLPLYNSQGIKQKDSNLVSCPTCHDPHRWNPTTKADSPDSNSNNQEGDVLSSFLRLKTTEGFICADCHGLDSIFRYKYFHGSARVQP